MKILILGASGQIGFPLLVYLSQLSPEHAVTGTSRRGQTSHSLPTGAKMLAFDPFVDDWTELGTFDLVYNCIGQIRASREMSFERIHEGLTEKLLEKRPGLGHPRIVQLSALGAGDHPGVPFLATKGLADARLLQEQNTAVVRPSIVCTENTMLLRKLRQLLRVAPWTAGRVVAPAGFFDAGVQPILIEDLVELLAKVGVKGSPERIVEAVGPEALSFGELLHLIAGKPVRQAAIPRWAIDPLIRFVIAPFLPRLINEDQYRLLFEDNVGSVEPVKQLLGRLPEATDGFWRR
jgi:uncharacterized protein YbjT (DUF2867 family)